MVAQINRVEYVHAKSFLHRDIKPDNFLMGLGRRANQVLQNFEMHVFTSASLFGSLWSVPLGEFEVTQRGTLVFLSHLIDFKLYSLDLIELDCSPQS